MSHVRPVHGEASTFDNEFSLTFTLGHPLAGRVSGGDFTIQFVAPEVSEPSCLIIPPPPLPESPAFAKNRAISVRHDGSELALRVTFNNLPAPFGTFNGQSMWVGPPTEYCENFGQTTPPKDGCGPAPGGPSLTLFAAELQCSPFYADWSGFSAVHIFGEFIVPSGVYSIQAIHQACDTASASDFSDALELTTSIWGDLVSDCSTSPCGPPDGSVDVVTDVTSCLDKFRNLVTGPSKMRSDVEPNIIDLQINISDVTFVLNAFGGESYPFEPKVSPPCGSTVSSDLE